MKKWIDKIEDKMGEILSKVNTIMVALRLGIIETPKALKVLNWLYTPLSTMFTVALGIWLLGLTGLAPVVYTIGVVGKVGVLLLLLFSVAAYYLYEAYSKLDSKWKDVDVNEKEDDNEQQNS